MQLDAEYIRNCFSVQCSLRKSKSRLTAKTKLNVCGKLLHKNGRFHDYDQKLNFNQF